PLKTLTRGYSVTLHEGKVIKSSKDLKSGDTVNLKFIDGDVKANVL
ncbi:MAG: exodeoxyribonuclease VII large subunit, partial [Clostridia bacterium]|nr:exodeoxyribonuclease VII large subunit [Clostridia bacterium]